MRKYVQIYGLLSFLVLLFLVPQSVFAQEGQGSNETAALTRSQAVDQFTREFVWAQDTTMIGVNQYGQQVSSSQFTNFYQGRHKRPLAGLEFYEVMNRQDLADEFRSRRTRKRVLIGSGIGMQVVGLGMMMVPIFTMDSSGLFDNLGLWMGGGGAMLLLGTVPMMIGFMTNPHPIEPHEAREIVEEYNLGLMRDLGLDRQDLPSEEEVQGLDSLRVNLQFSEDGAGVKLGFRF